MKILFINVDSGFGGSTGRIVNDLYKEAIANGHKALILYGREFDHNAGVDAVRVGSNAGIYAHAFLSRLSDRTGFFSTQATENAIRVIKEFDPDIIHLHNIHGYYINIKLLFGYLKTCGKQIVWTLHDCWAFTGHCTYFTMENCYKWRTGCCSCPQRNCYPQSLVIDNSRRNYADKKHLFSNIPNMTIVTPSKWLSELVTQSYLHEYKVLVINNGINLSVFKQTSSSFRSERNLIDKKILLGVASIWDQRKGLRDFITLSTMLNENYQIVLIGVNEKQKKLLPNNIISIARTNNAYELAEIYSSADAFLNLTYEDNYPTVNLEAIACGTPVITYDTGGSPEPIDNRCGRIIKRGDVKAVIRALDICDVDTSDDCIQKAKEQFDKSLCFKRYIELYGELLS